jgi:PAS domain S-box-containing protein
MSLAASIQSATNRVRGSPLGRHAIAVALVFVAFAVRAALAPAVPAGSLWSVAVALGVAVAAWFGGWGPIAFATLLTLTLLELIHGRPAAAPWNAPGGEGPLQAAGLVGQTAIVSLCVAGLVRGRDDRRLRRVHDDVVSQLGQRLIERGEDIHAILRTSPTGIAIAEDPECERLATNAAVASMLANRPHGSAPDSATMSATMNDRDIAPLRELMRRAVAGAAPIGPIELEIVQADGTHRSIVQYAAPLLDGDGRTRGCVAALVDTTELDRVERALRERDRALRRNFESASVGKARLSRSTGRIECVNRRLCAMLGRGSEELTRHTIEEVIEPDERTRIASMLHAVTTLRDREVTGECRFLRSDGVTVYAAISIAMEFDGASDSPHVIVAVQDITARSIAELELSRYRRQLEEQVVARTASLEESNSQLRLSERMAALGTLCAGLGHDMGNLLLPVRLRLEAMEMKGVPLSIADDVKAIGTCAEYLQRLANGLRLLSLDPDRPCGSETTNLIEWWADVESFLRNCLPRGIELERRFDERLPLVRVPRHRLTQAIFNLVQNAGDAMGGAKAGGRVRMTASAGPGAATVRIVVSDDGRGMTPEVRARCFEPFFTMKPRGISTGLGLSLVHGIVQQSGGSIEVESVEGEGTSFTLTFQSAAAHTAPASVTPSGQPIRVFVSVDDARLRSYAVAVGKAMGCVVDDDATPPEPRCGTEDPEDCIWVASAGQLDADGLNRYLSGAGHSSRKVIAFGESPDGTTGEKRVQWIANPTPSRIRVAFRECVAGLTHASTDAAPEAKG